jgi:hypothetical protein
VKVNLVNTIELAAGWRVCGKGSHHFIPLLQHASISHPPFTLEASLKPPKDEQGSFSNKNVCGMPATRPLAGWCDKDSDWGFIRHPNDMKLFETGMNHDRLKTTQEFVQSMITRPLHEGERDSLVAEMLRTPTYVALLLDYDGLLSDFTSEARMIDGKIPVLHVLANPGWYDGWTETGRAWLAVNAPNAKVAAFGQHMLQWELPDKFNAVVDEFLGGLK